MPFDSEDATSFLEEVDDLPWVLGAGTVLACCLLPFVLGMYGAIYGEAVLGNKQPIFEMFGGSIIGALITPAVFLLAYQLRRRRHRRFPAAGRCDPVFSDTIARRRP